MGSNLEDVPELRKELNEICIQNLPEIDENYLKHRANAEQKYKMVSYSYL